MKLNATTIGGANAILETDFNQTFTGLPLAITEHHDTIDNSTLAPVPNGVQAAAACPELLDVLPPIVVPDRPGCSLRHRDARPGHPDHIHPNGRISRAVDSHARQRDPPNGTHADLTNGDPAGAVVAPAGGAWDTPTLVVTLTLSAAYLTALGAGRHHFYMTGVSRRGLSSVQESIITVS